MQQFFHHLFHILLLLVFLIGILSLKKSSIFFKLIFFQVVYTCLTTVVAILYKKYQIDHGMVVNNMWLGNINLFIELSIIFYAFRIYLKESWIKKSVTIAYLIFVSVYALTGWQQGFWVILNYADLTSCFLMTLILVYAYFIVSQEKNISIWKSPEKLAIMGMLIYFAGSIPFIAMWDYLITNSPKVLALLYVGINYTIAYIRYIFVGIAFWLIYKNAKKQIISS